MPTPSPSQTPPHLSSPLADSSADADDRAITPPDPEADRGYDEAFADLAQIIAHRIRSLTSSIESYADLLSDAIEGEDERELVFRILEGTARIEYVLSDLLLYGKPLQPAHLPMRVEDIVRDLNSLLTENERRLVRFENQADGSIQVLADPKLVQQALLSLVHNAVEALDVEEDGAVRVRIFQKEGDDPELVVSVCNPGTPGTENPEQMLFRPFFTTKAQNLGLGLPMARRIAQAHDGHLRLVSHDAESGTCFEMAFPLEVS